MASLIDYMLQTQNAIGANTKQDAENDKSIMMNQIYQQNPLLAVSGSLPAGFAGQALFAQLAKGSPLTRDVGNQVDQMNKNLSDWKQSTTARNLNLIATAGARLATPEIRNQVFANVMAKGYTADQAKDIIARDMDTAVLNNNISPAEYYSSQPTGNPMAHPAYANNLEQPQPQPQPQPQSQPLTIGQQLTGSTGMPAAPLAGLGGGYQAAPPVAATTQASAPQTQSVASALTQGAPTTPYVQSQANKDLAAQNTSNINANIKHKNETAQQQNQSIAGKNLETTLSAIESTLPSISQFAGLGGKSNALWEGAKAALGINPSDDYKNYNVFMNDTVPAMASQYQGYYKTSVQPIVREETIDKFKPLIGETDEMYRQRIHALVQLLRAEISQTKQNPEENDKVPTALLNFNQDYLAKMAKNKQQGGDAPSGSSPVDMIAPDGTHGSANPDKVKYLLSKGYRRANG